MLILGNIKNDNAYQIFKSISENILGRLCCTKPVGTKLRLMG